MGASKVFRVAISNNVDNSSLSKVVVAPDVEAACVKVRTEMSLPNSPFVTISECTVVGSADFA